MFPAGADVQPVERSNRFGRGQDLNRQVVFVGLANGITSPIVKTFKHFIGIGR